MTEQNATGRDTAQEKRVTASILYVCDPCQEHSPESCGYPDVDHLRVAPDGTCQCEGCWEAEAGESDPNWSDLPKPVDPAAPASDAQGWRDIASAPKDEEVLLFGRRYGFDFNWDTGKPTRERGWHKAMWTDGDEMGGEAGWVFKSPGYMTKIVDAIAWAPLPPTGDAMATQLQLRQSHAILTFLCEQHAYSYGGSSASEPTPPEMGLEWHWQASTPERPTLMQQLTKDAIAFYRARLEEADPDDMSDWERECQEHLAALGETP